VSPCDPLFGPDRRENGVICTGRGRRRGKKQCGFCHQPTARYECDGPKPGGKTCDADICGACAVSIRALDVDYCPRCVDASELLGCKCGPTAEHPCRGPIVAKDQLCLAHCLIFTHWLRDLNGFRDVYSDRTKTNDEKRQRFRFWLSTFTSSAATALFHRFGWRSV
jgi:hypothetical protein